MKDNVQRTFRTRMVDDCLLRLDIEIEGFFRTDPASELLYFEKSGRMATEDLRWKLLLGKVAKLGHKAIYISRTGLSVRLQWYARKAIFAYLGDSWSEIQEGISELSKIGRKVESIRSHKRSTSVLSAVRDDTFSNHDEVLAALRSMRAYVEVEPLVLEESPIYDHGIFVRVGNKSA